jgi:ribosomal protein S18 acetylase RimI-like enzyme
MRPLAAADLDAVIAIDAALQGRSRRLYIERRLAAALREPRLHAQFAATEGSTLVGYLLARVLEGEFGSAAPSLRIELVGVRPDRQQHGIGRKLLDALKDWGVRHRMREVGTIAAWTDHSMLRWLDAMRFAMSAAYVMDCPVRGGAYDPQRDDLHDASEPSTETNYATEVGSRGELVRDAVDVRSMAHGDLADIVRIDRRITSRDRTTYIGDKLSEAMHDSAVRVSLTARLENTVAGYLMARVDFGDYGRTEPVAVLDTIGVDPGFSQRGVGRALLSQLFVNLGALRIERVETIVAPHAIGLLRFFDHAGFVPSQRLSFVLSL